MKNDRLFSWLLLAIGVAGVFFAFYLAAQVGWSKRQVGELSWGVWLLAGVSCLSVAIFFFSVARIFPNRSRADRALIASLFGGVNLLLVLWQIGREGWTGENLLTFAGALGLLLFAAGGWGQIAAGNRKRGS